MRKTAIFFLILLVSFRIPLVNSAPNEGYGEANENLGQFTDTFINETYVAVLSNVIVNTTLECVELNYSDSVTKEYEDFTIYTQVEEGNEIDVQSPTYVEFADSRSKTSYLFYDFGVDYFGDFTHEVDFYRDTHGSSSWVAFWMLSNYLGGEQDHRDMGRDYLCISVGGSSPAIGMREYDSGNFYSAGSLGIALDTWYYISIEKVGVAFSLDIYSTAGLREIGAGGDLLNTALVLHQDHKMRYGYAGNTHDDGGGQSGDSHLRNYWFGKMLGGYLTEGYFITEDYLNYTTGNSLTLLTNTSIPENTTITVQFSPDNSTWAFNDWDPIFGGFEAIDLRILNYSDIYLMYNFSGQIDSTPRLYQSRLVSTEGAEGGGETVINVESDTPWIAIAIILSVIAFLLSMRLER